MTRPTPGPYFVRRRDGGAAVEGIHGMTVGWFGRGSVVCCEGSHEISAEEAEANARAWVEGQAAVDTLAKIRQVMKEWREQPWSTGVRMIEIAGILDEAKP